jgi:glycosyltransferase involved in cell wall biosynthesis
VKACVLIPVYDHGETLAAVLDALGPFGLPGLVVDDGSHAPTRDVIDKLPTAYPWVAVERFPENRGRGAALRHGYQTAALRGFSHAVQVDADGQHDVADVPRFLAEARARPDALVLGRPMFDHSAPRSRRYGRELSRFWVNVETWSRAIGDPLCGFRCVPLEPMVRLLARAPLGDRMEFDPELAVRWVWNGGRVVNVPTRVVYPPGGRSHFRLVGDNARITWMHTRLVAGTVARQARRVAGVS